MTELYDELIAILTTTEVNTASALYKLVISAALGGAIGFERKRRGQIAGARTFALISMGATLAMLVSSAIPQLYTDCPNGDPARVAAQVISGIGFLGAGAIIQTKSSIRGLTTAAGIWVAAGIGLAVGIGLYMVAFIAMILILITLIWLDYYAHKIDFEWDSNIIRLRLPLIVEDVEAYEAVFKQHRVKLHEWFIDYDYKQEVTTIDFVILKRGKTDIKKVFAALRQLNPTDSITLLNEI